MGNILEFGAGQSATSSGEGADRAQGLPHGTCKEECVRSAMMQGDLAVNQRASCEQLCGSRGPAASCTCTRS